MAAAGLDGYCNGLARRPTGGSRRHSNSTWKTAQPAIKVVLARRGSNVPSACGPFVSARAGACLWALRDVRQEVATSSPCDPIVDIAEAADIQGQGVTIALSYSVALDGNGTSDVPSAVGRSDWRLVAKDWLRSHCGTDDRNLCDAKGCCLAHARYACANPLHLIGPRVPSAQDIHRPQHDLVGGSA